MRRVGRAVHGGRRPLIARTGPLHAGLGERSPDAGHAAPERVAAEPATRTAHGVSPDQASRLAVGQGQGLGRTRTRKRRQPATQTAIENRLRQPLTASFEMRCGEAMP